MVTIGAGPVPISDGLSAWTADSAALLHQGHFEGVPPYLASLPHSGQPEPSPTNFFQNNRITLIASN